MNRTKDKNLSRTKHLTYRVWWSMMQRCYNKNIKNFHNYGGRGISVSDDWKIYKNFLRDMGLKPDTLSLDRIDNNGNYCKENCRWTSRKVQNNNKRTNVKILINGSYKTVSECSDEFGLKQNTINYRIYRGLSTEEDATKPLFEQASFNYNGTIKTIKEWNKLLGLGKDGVQTRIKRGWSDDKTFNTPSKRIKYVKKN